MVWWSGGLSVILGIDEVGRGSWAGPLVVGAAILADEAKIDGLTDSKKLTKKRREELVVVIKQQAVWWNLGWVEATEINQIGLSQALRLATKRSVESLPIEYAQTQIIIDGTIDFLDDERVSTLKKADLLVPSVSAAAILAKVARDEFMIRLSTQSAYQSFGFDSHVGYGTAAHRQALERYGLCDQHRTCFKPMSSMIGTASSDVDEKITTKQIGDAGEQAVVDYLETQGYQIVARNWRTAYFEIDIVAKKDQKFSVVEVKTRKNTEFGGGLVAIDRQKLKKLRLAADLIFRKHPEATVELLIADVASGGGAIDLITIDN